MKPTMIKTSIREVKGSFGRYVAILAIVALGVGFFSGLKVSKTAMLTTGEEYLEAHAFHHFFRNAAGIVRASRNILRAYHKLLAKGRRHFHKTVQKYGVKCPALAV